MFDRLFGRKTVTGKRGEPMPVNNDGLPDSSNPAGLCPRCEKQSSFHISASSPVTFDGGRILGRGEPDQRTYTEQVSVLICHNCQQGVTVLEEMWVGEYRKSERKGGGTISWKGFHWWPLAGLASHVAIPGVIADALSEAVTALSANCPRAAAVMARRTLEAIAVEQGETTGVLAQRLANMAAKNILQPTLADWAKEVRLVGNVGAHFDPINIVSNDDASQLIEFVRELAKFIYVLPFELNARRSAKP
jgi:hypothetical protein